MKTITLILMTMVFLRLEAQTPESSTDSIIFTPFYMKIDSIFMRVDLSRMNTNYLLNKSFVAVNPVYYNGVLTDSTKMNPYGFQGLFNTLFYACQDTNNILPVYDSIENVMDSFVTDNSTSIAILAMDYDRIRPDAIDSGLLSLTSDSLYLKDVLLAESPFETLRTFAFQLNKDWFDTMDIYFNFRSNLLFTNFGGSILNKEVDFDDGNGFIPLNPNTPNLIHYDSIGTKNIVIKITLNDYSVLYSQSEIEIRQKSKHGLDDFSSTDFVLSNSFFLEAEDDYSGTKASAQVTIALGCGHSILTKPLIIVPGIDHPQIVHFDKNGNETFIDFFQKLENSPGLLFDNLKAEGYDLVYIDYTNGADHIQKNGKLVETVIRFVNAQKASNGITEPTSILGVSMGGVVARYALLEMESNNEDHEVNKFISFDSPHNGANIPLGTQAFTAQIRQCDIWLWARQAGLPVLVPVNITKFIPLIRYTEEILGNPATRQLLTYHYYCGTPNVPGPNSQRTTLMNDLTSFHASGWPQNVELIFISNGSGAGTSGNQGFNAEDKLANFKGWGIILTPPFTSDGLNIPYIAGGYHADIDIWAMPPYLSSFRKVYSANINGFLAISRFKYGAAFVFNKDHKVKYVKDIDNAPGGTGEFSTQGQSVPGLNVYHPNFCFIPSVSSAGLVSPYKDDLYFDINSSWNNSTQQWSSNQSPSEHYVNGFQNTNFTSPENQDHCDWTILNSIFTQEMLVGNPIFPHGSPINSSARILNNDEFNFGGTSSKRISSTDVSNGGRLLINTDDPIGLLSTTTFGNPTNGSDFKVETNGTNCDGPTIINIYGYSSLEIGDNTTSNTGELLIKSGDIIHFWNNSQLIINNNSKLKIEKGATMIFDDGATILLQGNQAQLCLNGTLSIEAGATFTFGKGSASNGGFVLVQAQSWNNGEGEFDALGANCNIELVGDGPDDVVLEVDGDIIIPDQGSFPSNYFTNFSIVNGKILYGAFSSIELACSLKLDNSTMESFPWSMQGDNIGFKTKGQSFLSITDCQFVNLDMGLENNSPSSGNILTIDNCLFLDCNTGIKNINSHIYISNSEFDGCVDDGVYMINPLTDCKFDGCRFHDGGVGLRTSSVTASKYIFLSDSRFYDNTTGCQLQNINLNLNCTRFKNNEVGIDHSNNGLINLSTGKTLTGSLYSDAGGYSTFAYNTTAGIYMHDYPALYLNNGYNNFIRNSSDIPANFLLGYIAYSTLTHQTSPPYPLLAGNNYWYPTPNPSLSSNNPDYYFVQFPYPGGSTTRNDFTGSMQSSAISTCYNPSDPGGIPPSGNSTSLSNIQGSTFLNIYPNPASNSIFVDFVNSQNLIEISIFSINGSLVYKCESFENAKQARIETSSIPVGQYFIKIISETDVFYRQIIILK